MLLFVDENDGDSLVDSGAEDFQQFEELLLLLNDVDALVNVFAHHGSTADLDLCRPEQDSKNEKKVMSKPKKI